MTKINVAAALILTGFLFAAGELFAQNHAADPAEFVLANAGGLSVPHPVDSGPIPVFKITPGESKIKFDVEASVAIVGTFDKWDASLTFTSTDISAGVLDLKIQADSVDTGSGMKNRKLKGKDFFNVKESPTITFRSNKVVQTGPNTFELDGDFSIRGVSKKEKLGSELLLASFSFM